MHKLVFPLPAALLFLACFFGGLHYVRAQEIQGTDSAQPLSDAQSGPAPASQEPTKADGAEPGYLGMFFVPTVGQQGAYVRSTSPGGPAALAGIRSADVITEVDGRPIRTDKDLANILQQSSAGDSLNIVYLRDGLSTTVTITLAKVPSGVKIGQSFEPSNSSRLLLGIRANPLSKALQEQFGLQSQDGVYVEQVYSGSPAETSGLPEGVVVVQMDDLEVRSPSELKTRLRELGGGKTTTLYYWSPENKSQTPEKVTVLVGGSSATGASGELWQRRDEPLSGNQTLEQLQEENVRLKQELMELRRELQIREQEIQRLRQ